jgi:hypothetical protein
MVKGERRQMRMRRRRSPPPETRSIAKYTSLFFFLLFFYAREIISLKVTWAMELARARFRSASWAFFMFSSRPCHVFRTEFWSARAYENDTCQGLGVWFMALRFRVDSSSLWPPERNLFFKEKKEGEGEGEERARGGVSV